MLQEQGLVFNQPNSKFKDYSGNIVVNNSNVSQEDIIKDKDTIIQQQKEIIALLREKLGFSEGK